MREYPRSWQEFQDILHWVTLTLDNMVDRVCVIRLIKW